MRPHTATRDKAAIYPPALPLVLPAAIHGAGKAEQRIERDHQHLKGRYRSMRGFKARYSAQIIGARQGFVRNRREGFSGLGVIMADPPITQAPRLKLAWDAVTEPLQVA